MAMMCEFVPGFDVWESFTLPDWKEFCGDMSILPDLLSNQDRDWSVEAQRIDTTLENLHWFML